MRLLTIVFLTAIRSLGQTLPTTVSDYRPVDIKGEFTIVWVADKRSFIGETFKIKKRHRFDYEVFSNDDQMGWNLVEKKIVTGKYLRNGDTLTLKSKESPKQFGPEFFSYKPNYILKGFELTIYIDNQVTKRQFVCLVPADKSENWDDRLKDLQKFLTETQDGQEGDGLLGLLNLTARVDLFFGTDKIFVKKV